MADRIAARKVRSLFKEEREARLKAKDQCEAGNGAVAESPPVGEGLPSR
jgi:hypothetical protein